MNPKAKPRALGRGLDALLGSTPAKPRTAEAPPSSDAFQCPVDRITPQSGQPRRHFDKARLDELAQSIRDHGLIEPIVVRKKGSGDRYEIVAGERRWRAAQRAGLSEVLVVVRDVTPKEAFELALIENIQREDLNAVEFAEALSLLMDEHDYTQEAVAERIGKDRSTIANALRLLKLPEAVRAMVLSGKLSEGHARALLGAPDAATMIDLAERVQRGRMSVRQAEQLVREAKSKKGASGGRGNGATKSPATRDLELRLARKLGTKCEVRDRKGQGEVVLKYASLDELDRLIDLLL